MWLKDPADTYKAYERFLRKGNYKKAYQCLETLHNEFPKDQELIMHIINFCYYDWKRPETARKWLIQLTKLRISLVDYFFLCHLEAQLGSIAKARIRLEKAKELIKQARMHPKEKKSARSEIKKLDEFINYKECVLLEKSREDIIEIETPDRNKLKRPGRNTEKRELNLKHDPVTPREEKPLKKRPALSPDEKQKPTVKDDSFYPEETHLSNKLCKLS